jgi:hypothetical protein
MALTVYVQNITKATSLLITVINSILIELELCIRTHTAYYIHITVLHVTTPIVLYVATEWFAICVSVAMSSIIFRAYSHFQDGLYRRSNIEWASMRYVWYIDL